MPKYAYRIRDSRGNVEDGVLVGADADEVSRGLRREGKAIVSLREAVDDSAARTGSTIGRGVKQDEVIEFAIQLAVMVDTGVVLTEALDSLAEAQGSVAMCRVTRDLADRVKGGVEFSTALGEHPKVFNRLFVALMRASEASGKMGQMLVRLSDYMEQERDARNRIKGALTYPACILSFCLIVVIGMLVFILPRFEKIYGDKGAMLPAPTRMLLGLSALVTENWALMLAATVACLAGAWLYLSSEAGKAMLDRVRINLPVLGKIYRKSYLARSLRTMSTMVSTGVSMLEGLSITAQVAGNRYYAKVWSDLAEDVKEGSSLSDGLYEHELIPNPVCRMIAAGEKTGKLAMVMDRVAVSCEEDLKVAIRTATSLIEPAMIVVMGLIVGGVAMALLLPVFSISKVVSN